MGFLSTLTGALKEGVRQGIASGLTSSLASLNNRKYYNELQKSMTYNYDYMAGRELQLFNNKEKYSDILGTMHINTTNIRNTDIISEKRADENTAKHMSTTMDVNTHDYNVINTKMADVLTFNVPDWTYADWINERTLWQKNITSILDMPGYFYFKIFFKFDTQHGLFGGLLNNADFTNAINSAAKYLYLSKTLYRQERPLERITALFKFTSLLSYISTSAPWYFKGIKGLDACGKPNINNFSEPKTIEIELLPDAVDMRLSTLMSLYKFVCYDDMNCKEILPDNLRKFDMSVVIFATPIKKLHTSMFYTPDNTEFKYKSLSPLDGSTDNWSNVMSYKMYTFQNCEFDIDTLGSYVPGSISNDVPFKMGENSIKIKFDRVYEHQMNEFFGFMFGSDGIYYNQYAAWQWVSSGKTAKSNINLISKTNNNTQLKRYKVLQEAIEDRYNWNTELANYDDNGDQAGYDSRMRVINNMRYKKLIDASEGIIHDKLINVNSAYALGNIYGEDTLISRLGATGKTYTDYYKMKLNHLQNRLSTLNKAGTNILLKMLESSYSANTYFGNLYGDTGVGSRYWKDKLKMLKRGTNPTDVVEFRRNQQSYENFNLDSYIFNTTRNKKI